MLEQPIRPIVFLGSSLGILRTWPEDARRQIGLALHLAQRGWQSISAKPLRGYPGGGVWQATADTAAGTFRAVYLIRLRSAIYVLHVFQKKSKQGISTPREELAVIRSRLRQAEARDRGFEDG